MRWTIALLLLTTPLVGCVGTTDTAEDLNAQSTEDPIPELPEPQLADGKVHLNVTVPIVTIGFPDESVEKLRDRLDPETVAHAAIDLNRTVPPNPEAGVQGNAPLSGSLYDMPIVPTADYEVRPVPNATEQQIKEKLGDWQVDDDDQPTTYDGRAFESFLAEELPEQGIEIDPNAPPIVLVHLDELDVGVHTWRYDMPNGYLDEVRIFGEREPMLVLDPSGTTVDEASVYDRVEDNATGGEHNPYQDRLDAREDLDRIETMIRNVTRFRMLQGSIYPMPLADCHAVTLILGIQQTSAAEHTDAYASAEEVFDPDVIEGAYENLTGDEVHVDTKVLELPVDDPALSALGRGELATMPAQRYWLDENWDDYWVPHEGCEAYVSFLVHNDAASAGTGVIGIGTYDHPNGRRISLSWMNEGLRLLLDPATPVVGPGDSIDSYNLIDELFAHEVGHTLGQRHPHDTTRPDGSGGYNMSYSDVWSIMSYNNNGRAIDFGAIDRANWQRNQAGWMAGAAIDLGLQNTTEFQQAMDHMAAYEWEQATDTLRPVVFEAAQNGDASSSATPLPEDLVLLPSPSNTHGFGPDVQRADDRGVAS